MQVEWDISEYGWLEIKKYIYSLTRENPTDPSTDDKFITTTAILGSKMTRFYTAANERDV